MARRLRAASLYAHARASVLVPLPWLPLASRIDALGVEWALKDEFHVTALSTPWLAQRAGVPVDTAWEAVVDALDGRRAGPVRLGEELRVACHGGERTILLMAHVDGLGELWADVAGRLGIPVPEPPTHVTLYTKPDGEGIGVRDEAELAERTRRLSAREAAAVAAASGLDALLDGG